MPPAHALPLVALCAIWGFAQVTMKWGGEGISPLMQTGLRSPLAVPFLLVWCRWRGAGYALDSGAWGQPGRAEPPRHLGCHERSR